MCICSSSLHLEVHLLHLAFINLIIRKNKILKLIKKLMSGLIMLFFLLVSLMY